MFQKLHSSTAAVVHRNASGFKVSFAVGDTFLKAGELESAEVDALRGLMAIQTETI